MKSLKKLRSTGVTVGRLSLSGGEPFLRPDLLHFVQAVREAAQPACVHLITNCSLLRDRLPLFISLRGLVDSIRFSCHPEILFDRTYEEFVHDAQVAARIIGAANAEISVDSHFYVVDRSDGLRKESAPSYCIPRVASCIVLSGDRLYRCDPACGPYCGSAHPEFISAVERDTLTSDLWEPDLIRQWERRPQPEPCLYCSGCSSQIQVPHVPRLGGVCGAATVIPKTEQIHLPELSVVIPYRDDVPEAKRNLVAAVVFWATHFTGMQIVVVQQSESDGVPRDIRDAVEVCDIPWEGVFSLSKTRNYGIAHASGAVVCLADRDAVLTPSAVQQAYKSLMSGDFDAVTPYKGWFRHARAQTYVPDVLENARQSSDGGREMLFGGAVFLSREAFNLFGRYDEEFDGYGHEDNEFRVRIKKLGGRIGEIDAPAWHMSHTVRESPEWIDVARHDERGRLVEEMATWPADKIRERHGLHTQD